MATAGDKQAAVTAERRDFIEVWRPHDLNQLELRRGFSVARPVPRHWHEEYQFCLVQAGPGELTYRGHCLPTPPASLFMVHPGEVHANRHYGAEGCTYRTLFIAAELMRDAAREIFGGAPGLPFFPTAVVFDAQVIRQYLELHVALERPSATLERQTRLLSLLAGLIARFAEAHPSPRAQAADRQAVRRAYDYLAEHFAENVSLDHLAAIAGLSPFHFNRLFAEQFGMPPHALQTQLRVLRAKALLLDGWPIPQVASLTGFADQSHLTRHFKRLVGVPPGQYQAGSKNVQDVSRPPR
ncbi:MAG TPA: AraC family transcriptional regulator [Blastocatellia bacterium]|nr:AraC family transcriptional regulator [Blastocatellia bacterium]